MTSTQNLSPHSAALKGELAKLCSAIPFGSKKDLVDSQDSLGRSSLIYSVIGHISSCVAALLDRGADVFLTDSSGYSALHYAVQSGDIKLLELLIRYSNGKLDKSKVPLLCLAALNGNIQFLPILLPISPKPNDPQALLLYHFASAGKGTLSFVEELIKLGYPYDLHDACGRTPLHIACSSGNKEVALLLLKQPNVNISTLDSQKWSVLHHAAAGDIPEVIDAVFSSSKDSSKLKDLSDSKGRTPLHIAAIHGSVNSLRKLLELGFSSSIRDSKKSLPLHLASFKGNTSCASLLFDHLTLKDGDNFCDADGATPLHLAALKGHSGLCYLLIRKGLDVNAKMNKTGTTPLHLASAGGDSKTSIVLLENGAKIGVTDSNGSTPLHTAAFNCNPKLVKVLIKFHSNVNAQDGMGNIPLSIAVASGSISCVQYLLKAGSNAELKNKNGESSLHVAGRVGATECCNLILNHLWNIQFQYFLSGDKELPRPAAPDPNTKDNKGMTPLHLAIINKHSETSKALILKGCDPSVKDGNGKTCSEFAISSGMFTQQDIDTYNKQRIAAARARDKDSPEYQTRLKEVLSRAVILFNTKPMKGIEHMREAGLLGPDPSDIADFLIDHPELNKTKIGELVGGSSDMHKAVLREFVGRMEFSGLEFEMALRRFLQTFRLPGEAQVIDRIMEAFAKHYYEQNPGTVFLNSDAIYVLAFSTIMLNTDAHSANVKVKMTKAEWLKTNRKINNGEDFPQSFLENLYERIVSDEIKMEQGIFTNADKKGWLTKQGGRIKTWKRRWFILSETNLFYFKTPQDKEPCGIILLENVEVIRVKTKKNCFMIRCFNSEPELTPTTDVSTTLTSNSATSTTSSTANATTTSTMPTVFAPTATKLKGCKMDSNGGMIEAHHDAYILCAESKPETSEWLAALNSAIHHNPFYALMRQKTDKARANPNNGNGNEYENKMDVDDYDDDDDNNNKGDEERTRTSYQHQSSIKLHLEKPPI